jgi:hypothetical protein
VTIRHDPALMSVCNRGVASTRVEGSKIHAAQAVKHPQCGNNPSGRPAIAPENDHRNWRLLDRFVASRCPQSSQTSV